MSLSSNQNFNANTTVEEYNQSLSMEEAQQMEWAEAQNITFSIDLVTAAKQQLRFLQVVDTTGCLYNGPALDRAIYRYKNCWLPLLAKHMNCQLFDGPLVVPLDCEWIWHCHRLNPVQYGRDCEKIYGKILENQNVLSTVEVEGPCNLEQTKSIWEQIYVTEPYNLDISNVESLRINDSADAKTNHNTIEYDLVASVKRQSSFFKKVSKMMKYGDGFMEEAVARYKAFNHLVKIIKTRQLNISCVPTLDIDLIWHAHQLNPLAYYKDMKAVHGKVIDHNDRDSGSLEGKKMMELNFVQTKQLWEMIFGNDYSIIDEESVPLQKSKYSVAGCGRECFRTSKASEDATIYAKECNVQCVSCFALVESV